MIHYNTVENLSELEDVFIRIDNGWLSLIIDTQVINILYECNEKLWYVFWRDLTDEEEKRIMDYKPKRRKFDFTKFLNRC